MKVKFDWVVVKILSRLDSARAYLDALEEALPHARDVTVQKLKKKAEADEWTDDEYFAEMGVLEQDFKQTIPSIASSAFVSFLYAIVEHGLISISNRLREVKDLPLKVNDIIGSPIDKSKSYLTKIAGIQIGDYPGWSQLMDLAKIRHIILHAGGEIVNSDIEQSIHRIQKQYPNDVHIENRWFGAPDEIRISLSF